MEQKLESSLLGKKINNLKYPDDTTHGRKPRGVKEALHEGDACFLEEKL